MPPHSVPQEFLTVKDKILCAGVFAGFGVLTGMVDASSQYLSCKKTRTIKLRQAEWEIYAPWVMSAHKESTDKKEIAKATPMIVTVPQNPA